MHRASYFISPVLFNVREAVVSKEQFFLPGSKNLTFTTLARWLSVHKTKRDAKLNVLHFVLLIISFLLHGYKGAVLFTHYKKYSILSCRLFMHRTSHFINPVLFNAREAVVSKEQFFLLWLNIPSYNASMAFCS